jgi:hypothetical protein
LRFGDANRSRVVLGGSPGDAIAPRIAEDAPGEHDEVGFEDLDQARAALLSLGPAIEVLEPACLRDMANAARQVVEIYDG